MPDMETPTDVIAVPFPYQGHLNPMLHFCSSLSARGLKVTLVLTHAVAKSMQSTLSQASIHTLDLISDGNEGVADLSRSTFQEYQARRRAAFSDGVAAIIEKQKAASSVGSPKVLVHDALMPWLLEVGKADGLFVATLFTQPASVCAVYYHMLHGHLAPASDSKLLRLPSLPELEFADLPSFSYFADVVQQVTEFNINQASNMPKADCFLINTFHSLEKQVVDWMAEKWAVKCVGPLVPIFHKTLHEKHDRIDLFELDSESYLKWLDIREPKSVVYVSFGSVVVMSEEQMEEIAWGLAQSNKYFIWVVRESELVKLPKDFKLKTSEKGIIVKWCPQVEVLSHEAVACFMTHCGWNSILEALCLGVPMVGMPQMSDQPTNAKLIEDVWKVGVRVKVNAEGITTRQEIKGCIKQVTGVRAEEFRRNVIKWRELAKEATSEGGSSYENIKDFVAFAKSYSD
ncbi:PREDICTED: UDP-glycosyltransferase 74E2-like isoform X1 [Ipomoea nil]|uniref:UDP-glycosyltransferase 74E2-like isoform X1 n=1 Tax=Ipomoea nil TaxID=35883 RepID=UPI000901BA95|nr:PREDICTED: UDP-glycosyltransferase 74E2-like isoform X1 [Ipomoea nil]